MPCLYDCVHVKCTCDRHEEYTYYDDFVSVQTCHCDAQYHGNSGYYLDYGTYQLVATRTWVYPPNKFTLMFERDKELYDDAAEAW